MITDKTRDEIVEMMRSVSDQPLEEIVIADDGLCDVFDAILDHITLAEIEEAMREDALPVDEPFDEDVDEDVGADHSYAHEAMHWAFQLGVAYSRTS